MFRVQTNKTYLHKRCEIQTDILRNRECINKIRTYLTVNKNKAIGIAANQLFMTNRIFGIRYGGIQNSKIRTFINPRIISQNGEQISSEGCMSIKAGKKHYHVKRPESITIQPDNMDNPETFEGYYATVIAHEMDHLNGILISDLISGGPNIIISLGTKTIDEDKE